LPLSSPFFQKNKSLVSWMLVMNILAVDDLAGERLSCRRDRTRASAFMRER
jgi:hypothetical protein